MVNFVYNVNLYMVNHSVYLSLSREQESRRKHGPQGRNDVGAKAGKGAAAADYRYSSKSHQITKETLTAAQPAQIERCTMEGRLADFRASAKLLENYVRP